MKGMVYIRMRMRYTPRGAQFSPPTPFFFLHKCQKISDESDPEGEGKHDGNPLAAESCIYKVLLISSTLVAVRRGDGADRWGIDEVSLFISEIRFHDIVGNWRAVLDNQVGEMRLFNSFLKKKKKFLIIIAF